MQLSENSENDTLQGWSKGGGQEPDGGQCPMRWQGLLGLINISLFRSAGAASVYFFVNTRGRPGPLPPSSPCAFPSVSNGNGWVVPEYLVLCLFTALITAATPTLPPTTGTPSPEVWMLLQGSERCLAHQLLADVDGSGTDGASHPGGQWGPHLLPGHHT